MENILNTDSSESLSAFNCTLFDQENGYGFALPLFSTSKEADTYFLQSINEVTNTIVSFARLEDNPKNLINLPTAPIAVVGRRPAYIFVDQTGHIHAGQLEEIANSLLLFAERHPDNLSINLQIYELVGTNDDIKHARHQMWQKIRIESGREPASSFFRGSILRPMLWDCLIAGAPNHKSVQRILSARGEIYFEIDINGHLKLHLSSLEPSDYENTDLDAVRNSIKLGLLQIDGEMDSQSHLTSLTSLAELDVGETPSDKKEISLKHITEELLKESELAKANHALEQLATTGRQEERTAILLDTIIDNISVGRRLVAMYQRDRAKCANTILAEVRELITSQLGSADLGKQFVLPNLKIRQSDEAIEILVNLALSGFSGEMAETRAKVLYYLSKYLSKYPRAKKILKEKFQFKYSIHYRQYEDELKEYLGVKNRNFGRWT